MKPFRTEIASLNQSGNGEDKFATIGERLGGGVEAIKDASDSTMEAIEKINGAVAKLKKSINYSKLVELVETVEISNNAVFEARTSQDMTGQRVTKIVNSVSYVEVKVTTLREIWGRDELDNTTLAVVEVTADENLLHGSQLKTDAISQDEIDKLFD